ncbi:MAG: hypothetical protein OXK76_14000 [Gammaproteobacteria bacterium]|nr:hypothetical protein [Gammaproteobacteria bacterium]
MNVHSRPNGFGPRAGRCLREGERDGGFQPLDRDGTYAFVAGTLTRLGCRALDNGMSVLYAARAVNAKCAWLFCSIA